MRPTRMQAAVCQSIETITKSLSFSKRTRGNGHPRLAGEPVPTSACQHVPIVTPRNPTRVEHRPGGERKFVFRKQGFELARRHDAPPIFFSHSGPASMRQTGQTSASVVSERPPGKCRALRRIDSTACASVSPSRGGAPQNVAVRREPARSTTVRVRRKRRSRLIGAMRMCRMVSTRT